MSRFSKWIKLGAQAVILLSLLGAGYAGFQMAFIRYVLAEGVSANARMQLGMKVSGQDTVNLSWTERDVFAMH